jgi:hypothetical protein
MSSGDCGQSFRSTAKCSPGGFGKGLQTGVKVEAAGIEPAQDSPGVGRVRRLIRWRRRTTVSLIRRVLVLLPAGRALLFQEFDTGIRCGRWVQIATQDLADDEVGPAMARALAE